MGVVYSSIKLVNTADSVLAEDGYLKDTDIRSIHIDVLADTGAVRMVINESIQKQLGLRTRYIEPAMLADGTSISLPVAGPITVWFQERYCTTEAIVLPGNAEPLMGLIPMESMDLVVIPKTQEIKYNPEHPDGPLLYLKQCM